MLSNEYLFPVRKTRRDFLAAGAAFTLATSGLLALDKDEPKNSLKLEVDPTWGKLPDGMKFGLGCAVVVDSKDRIIAPRDRPTHALQFSISRAHFLKPGARIFLRALVTIRHSLMLPLTAFTGARNPKANSFTGPKMYPRAKMVRS